MVPSSPRPSASRVRDGFGEYSRARGGGFLGLDGGTGAGLAAGGSAALPVPPGLVPGTSAGDPERSALSKAAPGGTTGGATTVFSGDAAGSVAKSLSRTGVVEEFHYFTLPAASLCRIYPVADGCEKHVTTKRYGLT
jgi:hypothetical protein